MGWRISCLSSYNRRRDQRLNAPEAVDPLAEGVLDVIVVLQAELVGVLFESHAHRPRGARLVGVVAAPQAIDAVQRGGRDGANTLDFAEQNRVPTGQLAPLLETPRQRDVPFAIPHFPRRCIYKLQKAACHACSENAKGSLCGCMAQTSFWAEMQKKGMIVSSAFPQPAAAGGTEDNKLEQEV